MKKCDCCKETKNNVIEYKLPIIGYGSFFDVLDEDEETHFHLCPECATEINQWVKKRLPEGVTLEDFWKCRVIEKKYQKIKEGPQHTYFEFEYEKVLIDVFLKFMPQVIFGEHYHLEKLKYKIIDFLFPM